MVSVDGELGGDASLRGLVGGREAEGQPRHIGGGALDALDDGDVLGHGGVICATTLLGGALGALDVDESSTRDAQRLDSGELSGVDRANCVAYGVETEGQPRRLSLACARHIGDGAPGALSAPGDSSDALGGGVLGSSELSGALGGGVLGALGTLGSGVLGSSVLSGALAFGGGGTLGDSSGALGALGALGSGVLGSSELSGALAFGGGGALGDSSGALGALGTLGSGVALAFGGGDALGGDLAEQRSVYGARKFSDLLAV
jgi:hypothetical protein